MVSLRPVVCCMVVAAVVFGANVGACVVASSPITVGVAAEGVVVVTDVS